VKVPKGGKRIHIDFWGEGETYRFEVLMPLARGNLEVYLIVAYHHALK